jgi:hypothetical protein
MKSLLLVFLAAVATTAAARQAAAESKLTVQVITASPQGFLVKPAELEAKVKVKYPNLAMDVVLHIGAAAQFSPPPTK